MNKHNSSCFNDDCRKAICLCKAALYKFNKQTTTANLNDFKTPQGKNTKTHLGSQEEKLAKLCQPTGLLYQNQHNLEDD